MKRGYEMTRKNKKQLEVKEKKAFVHPYTKEKHLKLLEIVRRNKEGPLERNGSLFYFCLFMLSIGFGIAAPFIYKHGLDRIRTEEETLKAILLTFFSFVGFCLVGGLAIIFLYEDFELFIKRKAARKVRHLFPKFSSKSCLKLFEKCSEDAKEPFSYDGELLYEMFKSRYEDAAFDMAAEEIFRIESRKKIQEFIAEKKKMFKKLPEILKKTSEIIIEKKRAVQGLPEHFLKEREKRKMQELKEIKEQEKAEIERMEKYLEKNSIDLRLDLRKETENERI